MAIKQYIGARYVPLPDGEWSATKQYEPLTIVSYGQYSYTSKKSVPAGIVPTNTEYWMLSGQMSSGVAELMAWKNVEVDPFITQTRADLESINNSLDNLDGRVDQTETDIVNIKRKKDQVVVIGDSWADEVHDPEVALNQILRQRFKCEVHNFAYGGTGFDVPNGYDYQLTLMQDEITRGLLSVDRIRFIILMCGLNDHYGGATAGQFRERLQDWYEKLAAIIDPLKIPVYWFQNYSIENDVTQTNVTTLPRQRQYYRDVMAGFNGCLTYVPMFGFVSSWRTNERHPDAAGHIAMAENVCNIIKGVPPRLYRYQRIQATINNDSITGADKIVYVDYYTTFGAGQIEVFMDVSGKALSDIIDGDSVTYDHTPPIDLLSRIIADTVYLADSNYSGFKLYIGGTRAYTRAAGRYYVEVMHTFGGT